jgi:hypothetical protein
MRENIDNLRRERLVFDKIYKKLERELAEKKKEMARIIEISNKAYEARDAAQQEMAGLKAQAGCHRRPTPPPPPALSLLPCPLPVLHPLVLATRPSTCSTTPLTPLHLRLHALTLAGAGG